MHTKSLRIKMRGTFPPQGGSARSTDGSSFELVRQRSGRGSFDLGRPRPLDRTSSLNEAKVGF